jgi:hypothetical protein
MAEKRIKSISVKRLSVLSLIRNYLAPDIKFGKENRPMVAVGVSAPGGE